MQVDQKINEEISEICVLMITAGGKKIQQQIGGAGIITIANRIICGAATITTHVKRDLRKSKD